MADSDKYGELCRFGHMFTMYPTIIILRQKLAETVSRQQCLVTVTYDACSETVVFVNAKIFD